MKVLMLLSNPYLPDARVYREAKSLLARGHEITVLAWDRNMSHKAHEIMEGIEVIRVGPKSSGKKSFVRDVRMFWREAYGKSTQLKFDAVHAHDFDTLPLGVKIKKKRGVPLIFDAHEIYSEMIRIDVPAFIAKMVQFLENHYLKYVDKVIVVNEYQRSLYSPKVGKDNIYVVMNAKPSFDDIDRAMNIREKWSIGDEIALIYIGALEPPRFVRELTDVADEMEGIKVIIGGYGSLQGYVNHMSKKKKNLIYLGLVHPEDVVPFSAAADLIVGMYREVQTDRIATKFFDAVASGRGMIVADNGEKTAQLVKKYGGGVVCDYSKEAFKKAIYMLDKKKIAEMGNNMKKLRPQYSWEAMEKRLISLYESLDSS
jgi:glycosyltransferase involved in cell wall biosynthesis